MPKLFGNSAIRDLHYKKIQLMLIRLSDEVKACEESETTVKNKKKLKLAQKQLTAAFNNLAEVRG